MGVQGPEGRVFKIAWTLLTLSRNMDCTFSVALLPVNLLSRLRLTPKDGVSAGSKDYGRAHGHGQVHL
jgi:hypothetical protein